MRGLWYRILILWYRLGGATAAQAEWRARRALEAPKQAQQHARDHFQRAADNRFKCVCGQLLVQGDKTCSQCDRRQIMPFWMRRVGRALGVQDQSGKVPATLLVGVTMAMGYLAQLRYGGGGFSNPSLPGQTLELGATYGSLTFWAQPWRAVTYTIVHGGLWHIAFNAIALSQIGPLVERRFGSSRFLAGWLLGAIGGAAAAALFAGPGFVVGASGAVFGLIGMAMLQGHREGTTGGKLLRNEMIKWAVYTTIFGIMIGGISHAGHFGGLAAGLAVCAALPPADHAPARRRLTPAIGLISVATLVLSLAAMVGWFFDRTVPADAEPEAQYLLYVVTQQSQGDAAVFTPDGAELLRVVRTERSLSDEAGMKHFAQARQIASSWSEVRRQMFLREMALAVQAAIKRASPRAPDSTIPPSPFHRR